MPTPGSASRHHRAAWIALSAAIAFPAALRAAPQTAPRPEPRTILEVIKDENGDGRADGVGRAVTLTGIAITTTRDTEWAPSTITVQDDTAGIMLTSESDRISAAFQPGDRLRAHGTVAQVRGVVQLRVDDATLVSHETPPLPRDVVAADLVGSKYPGLLVRLTGQLIVSSNPASDAHAVHLHDASGVVTVAVPDVLYRDESFSARLRRGGVATITGIAAHRPGRIIPWRTRDLEFRPLPPYRMLLWLATVSVVAFALAAFRHRRQTVEALATKQADTLAALEQSQTALRRSEAGFRSFVQNSPFGVYRSAPDGTILDVNPALVAMLDYESAEDLMARKSPDLYRDPGERARIRREHPNGVDGLETEFKRKDGSVVNVRLTSRHVFNLRDEPECFEITVENLTERRALEQQLRQSQKLEAIGRLAGGVAHDFNNQLVPILGYAAMLKESLVYGDPRLEDVEEIQRAAERAAALTKQLLIFSRKQVHRPTFVNLNALVLDLINMLRRVLGADIDLKTAFSTDLPTIKADPGHIEQIVMNLIVNARDAMPSGGRVTIETALVERPDTVAPVEGQAPLPGRYVRLAVIDTGTGMTSETKARIFEPFFTTKEVGKGTGLGLATVFGIVRQSGGFITVESEPGAGTSFQLYFPEARGPVGTDSRDAREGSEDSGGGHELVLLAEDEASVRRFTRTALEHNGYRVLEASDPSEAIRLAETATGRIDVLLTDIMMPGMSGVDLSVRLLKTQPDLKVVYMSGYADDRPSHGPFPPGAVFLQKPFAAATLARTLRGALDGVRA